MLANTPLVESPFFEKEIEQLDLTEQQKKEIREFHENGYFIFDTDIDHQVIDRAMEELEPRFEKLRKKDATDLRITDAWKYCDAVRQIAIHPQIQDYLKLFYQRRPIPFQTLNFPRGTQQKTHSDMIHFNSIPQRFMCGVWVAFEEIHKDNGPLHYYPGSHKLPFYDMIDIGVKGSKNTDYKKEMMSYAKDYEVFIEKLVDSLGLKKETLHIQKGQAIIWSANLLHGGDPINAPGSTRHSQVTHYFFEDCMYYTPYFSDIAINKIYLRSIKDINTGKKVTNKYFEHTIHPDLNRSLKNSVIELLSKISHLFPDSIVENTKKIIGK